MLGLLVMSLALAVCQGDLCDSEPRICCTCRNDAGKLLFISSHHKENDREWATSIKGTKVSCGSHSALDLWNEITATTTTKDKCKQPTPSPPKCEIQKERPSDSEMINKGYERHGSSVYKFHTITENWENARRTCQSEGAHLAIVNSEAEARIMEIIFARYPDVKNTFMNEFALVGFHDQFTEGNFLTIFGEPIAKAGFSEWLKGEPNNKERDYTGHPGENCGSVDRKIKLNDIMCSKKLAFFCELEDGYYPPNSEIDYSAGYYTGVESVIKPPPGKVVRRKPSSEYIHFPGVGFYKMHSRTEIWENARRICESENAHLAIINSEQESAVLSVLLTDHPLFYDVKFKDFAFIGFHDQYIEGTYLTIYNESLESTGFTKWFDKDEPNNSGGSNIDVGEDCGGVHRNGGLNDLSCDMRQPFICEQPLLE